MSKYDSRINNLQRRANALYMKMNVFISIEKLTMVRDYYKSLLDDGKVEPDDLQEMYTQLDELVEECEQDESINYNQKLNELIGDNNLIYTAFCYRFFSQKCIENPNGEWIPNKHVQVMKLRLRNAKNYFDQKRENSLLP